MVQQIFQAAHDAHHVGQLDQAEALYRQGLAQKPDHPEALHMLGVILAQKGWHGQAIELIRRAIAINPLVPDCYFNLGLTFGYCEELDAAMACYRQTLALQPSNHAALDQLGILLDRLERFSEAIDAWKAALEIRGDVAAYHANLGCVLVKTGQLDSAIAKYREAIKLAPNDPNIFADFGTALMQRGQNDEALAAYSKAMELDPNLLWLQCNMGELLTIKGRCDEAKAVYRRVIAADPKFYTAYNNLGSMFLNEGDLNEALPLFRKAVEGEPASVVPHWNYARVLLQLGNFEQGWEEAEWRLKMPSLHLNRGFSQPPWEGANPFGKTILLHTEGGYGDALHFIRLVPAVAARGAKLILECQPSLAPLFQGIPGLDRIIPRGTKLPEFDFHIPLQSLPRILKITLSNIPNKVPYITAPTDRVEYWAKRLSGETKRRIGLAWAGTRYVDLERRSRTLDVFAPLAKVSGVKFFSLQKGEDSGQIPPAGMDWVDWTSELNDFADTAALVQNLDLVISVDTSVAHLAGALGKPVWVLIPYVCDFRWLTERPDSPWYPTMRLFRQPSPKDWNEPVARMTQALIELAGK